MAVFLWIYGIVSPFAGVVADRVSRKKLVVGSLFVWSAVTYLMGYATDFQQLYWLRALMGISEALYMIMTNGFGASIGTILAMQVVNHYVVADASPAEQIEGWRTCWTIFSAYALIVFLAFGLAFKEHGNAKN